MHGQERQPGGGWSGLSGADGDVPSTSVVVGGGDVYVGTRRDALAHQRWPNARIAAELGCALTTVRTWRHRFARGGMPSLRDRPRPGRPEVYGPDVRLAIVATAPSVPPEGVSAWTHPLITGQLAAPASPFPRSGRSWPAWT
jgi:hypothetical protein